MPERDPVGHAAFEGYYQTMLMNEGASLKKKASYIIPVVVHIIHVGGPENVTDAQVTGLITRLNEDFSQSHPDTSLIRPVFRGLVANVGIEFRLARADPKGNCTNGITRTWSAKTSQVDDYGENNVKSLIKWNKERYLNIWVVKSIKPFGEGTTLGYAYYPGSSNENDGIVIRFDQMTSATLTHEVGHYLNLLHTFDAGCNSENDLVDDTPPAAAPNFGCSRKTNSCTTDSPDQPDQVENHMDYSNCRVMFTKGQKTRMLAALYYYRSTLYSQDNLALTGVTSENVNTLPVADFSIAEPYVCLGQAVRLSNASCTLDTNATYLWVIKGGQRLTSTDTNPVVVVDSPGRYSVELTVTNGDREGKLIRPDAFMVANTSRAGGVMNVDFDFPLGAPEDWLFTQTDGLKWTNSYHGYNGGNCLFVNNYSMGIKGKEAVMHLPPINLYRSKDPYLRYQVAHAYDDSSQDVLSVFVSIDCGENWNLVRQDVSSRLSTVNQSAGAFYPKNDGHWRNYEVNLSFYKNMMPTHIKFIFTSGGGNNLFIDNIRVGTTAISIDEDGAGKDLQVHLYPNPSTGWFTLESPGAGLVKWEVLDHTGRIISNASFHSLPTTAVVQVQGLSAGFYLAKIQTEEGAVIKQFVIN
jgi:PKD repeat protein